LRVSATRDEDLAAVMRGAHRIGGSATSSRADALARPGGSSRRSSGRKPRRWRLLRTAAGRRRARQRARTYAAPCACGHRAPCVPKATRATLVSASPTTVVYKALLSSSELGTYLRRLARSRVRFRGLQCSTSASAQHGPELAARAAFGIIAHNGEIDTITGNRAWMRARGVLSPRGASDSLEYSTSRWMR